MGFIDEVSDYTKFWLRTKDDKQAFEETGQDLLKKIDQLSSKDEPLSFNHAMSVFKEVAENPVLENLFDKYPDLMEKNHYRYVGHSSMFKLIFKYTVQNISTEEVMIMANYLASNRIMQKLQIEDMSQDAIIYGLIPMSEKCPLKDKLKLYSLLDSSGAISAGYKTSHSKDIGHYIRAAFKEVQTEKMLAVLKHSESWLNLKKDKPLVDWIIKFNERLLPAIHYSKKDNNT